jgi:hypothetical protein
MVDLRSKNSRKREISEETAMSARTELERQEVKRLISLMKDPRYWHADDPAILRDLRNGFKQLWDQSLPADSRARPAAAEPQT